MKKIHKGAKQVQTKGHEIMINDNSGMLCNEEEKFHTKLSVILSFASWTRKGTVLYTV